MDGEIDFSEWKPEEVVKKSGENNTNSKILQIAAVVSVGFVLYKLITK